MEVWEKSKTVDPEVRAYVYSLVNAVGGSSTIDDKYAVGDDALAALHDIVRWLKLYDEKLRRDDVKRCLAEANLVNGDLVEIMALWSEEQTNNKLKAKLALACVQLIVPLTWPFDLDQEKFTVNNHRHLPFLQLAHVSYKRTLLGCEHAKILRTAVRVGLPHMAIPRRDRTRRDEGIIKLILYLFRNIAQITQPQHLPSQGDENDVSRSATIQAFNDQDVFALLLTVGSAAMDEFQEEDVMLLEILFHLVKGVDPKKLFMKQEQVNKHETQELKALIQKEKAMLSGYNKTAPSRHHRFGTMLWVKRGDEKTSTVTGPQAIADESSTLEMMDASKKWNKPKYRGRANAEFDEKSDFEMRIELTESAREVLCTFVEDILDSSFNPLFASLRKAIASEYDRVSEMHIRQYFYLIHWFLAADLARRERRQEQGQPSLNGKDVSEQQENVFAYIAAVLDQETFILLNRQMQRAFDDKDWQLLQATLLCFTQTLLTVQSMAKSSDEEDQEIAENIQSRIFYEEATHDRIVQILRGYKSQGFWYLDVVTECVHVFVRLLEKYSKQNVDLMVRSKRRARKSKRTKTAADPDTGANAEEDAEDVREAQTAVSERKFDFARFSGKFLAQGCVDTFITFLGYFRELTPAQLKRCHRYLYRLAFKHELTVLLFRVDVLQLLHRMIKSSERLDPARNDYNDWEQLIQQVFRRCIRWIDRSSEGEGWREVSIIEMLFSKLPNTLFYLQNGYERVIESKVPRPPAELEFKPKVEAEKRMAVIVSLLVDQTKSDAIGWVRSQLVNAVTERQAWEDEQVAREVLSAETLPEPVSTTPPSIFLVADSKERSMQLFKDKQLRLLLTTIGCQRLGQADDVAAAWIFPSELSSTQLQSTLDQLNKAEFDPLVLEEGQSASDLVRNKVFRTNDGPESDDENGGHFGGELDESLFPPNLREPRKEGAARPARRRLINRKIKVLTEDELRERAEERKRKERERNQKIKSQLYVTAADDESDEEADAEFFRLEEQRRTKMAGDIQTALRRAMDSESDSDEVESMNRSTITAKKNKRKSPDGAITKEARSKRTKHIASDVSMQDADLQSDEDTNLTSSRRLGSRIVDSDTGMSDSSDEDGEGGSDGVTRQRTAAEIDDSSDEEVDGSERDTNTGRRHLSEISRNAVATKTGYDRRGDLSEDDDGDGNKLPMKRNVRAGFIIDDSDDE